MTAQPAPPDVPSLTEEDASSVGRVSMGPCRSPRSTRPTNCSGSRGASTASLPIAAGPHRPGRHRAVPEAPLATPPKLTGQLVAAQQYACQPDRGNRTFTSRSVVVVPAVKSKTVALTWVVELYAQISTCASR